MEVKSKDINLSEAIAALENRKRKEEADLVNHAHLVFESIKPINVIKSTLREISESDEIKDSLKNMSVGLAAGYLSKRIFDGKSHNPIKKLLGTGLMYLVSSGVSKNPVIARVITTAISSIIAMLKPKPKSAEHHG